MITIDPLIHDLQTFEFTGFTREGTITGNDKQALIPVVHKLIEHKGYRIFEDEEHFFRLMNAFFETGNMDLLELATRIPLGGLPPGLTAYSTNQQILPNYVTFNYGHYDPNMQLAISLHEFGHVCTPTQNIKPHMTPADLRQDLRMREAIAYAVEFGTCTALGLDTRLNCLQGLSRYKCTPQDLHDHKQLILASCDEALAWIEAHN